VKTFEFGVEDLVVILVESPEAEEHIRLGDEVVKCNGCNWEVSKLFIRAETREGAVASPKQGDAGLCGECYAEMLAEDDARQRFCSVCRELTRTSYGEAQGDSFVCYECKQKGQAIDWQTVEEGDHLVVDLNGQLLAVSGNSDFWDVPKAAPRDDVEEYVILSVDQVVKSLE
jgi:hypothetical protein